MATILKVMFDDHARIKRLFARAKRMPNDLDTALAICQEHDIHTTIEDEIVYPVLEELAPELAEQAEADHEKANGIVDEIYKYDVADSTLRPLVEQLEWITSRHIAFEEAEILPVLKNGLAPQEVIDMGLAAFARRQEELEGVAPRRIGNAEVIPNSGWGNSGRGGTVSNAGW